MNLETGLGQGRRSGDSQHIGPCRWIKRLSAAALLFLVLGMYFSTRPSSVDITLEMASTTGSEGQVFWSISGPYAEQDSTRFAIADDGTPHVYRIRIQSRQLPRQVRLDPGTAPGKIRISRIEMTSEQGAWKTEGSKLLSLINNRNHLETATPSDGTELLLLATGPDPWLEIDTPDAWQRADTRLRMFAWGGIIAGILAMSWLAWTNRRHLFHATGHRRPHPAILIALSGASVLTVMTIANTGCATALCSPRGLRHGLHLLVACLGFATIGAAILGNTWSNRRTRLFLWIAVGQAAMALYIYLRSTLAALAPWLRLSQAEIWLVVIACAFWMRVKPPRGPSGNGEIGREWHWLELGALATICLVVSDRELPRVLMLSTDPDTHAYLTQRLTNLGSIPFRGEAVFGYPAGSAAIGYAWSQLGFMDPRNAITALPLLSTFISAMIVGESIAEKTSRVSTRALTLITALAITCGAFMLPLFERFSHMEGTARQFSIVFAAGAIALLGEESWKGKPLHYGTALSLLATLFILAVLNPASIVVPFAMTMGYALHLAMTRHRLFPLAAIIVATPLALLIDPYYFGIFFPGHGRQAESVASGHLSILNFSQIFSGWLDYWREHPLGLLQTGWSMGRGQHWPVFGILMLASIILISILGRRRRYPASHWMPVLLVLFLLSLAESLTSALAPDLRFYLLAPYFAFSMTQAKILLLTAAITSIIVTAAHGLPGKKLFWTASLAAALVLVTSITMRMQEPLRLQPRYAYCGPSGCPTTDDIAVMEGIHQLQGRNELGTRPRILLPNVNRKNASESWIFPVTAARSLPFFANVDVAFYYYMGDFDYTNGNYQRHVCEHFDRNWLASQGIGYLFLPSQRNEACVDGMEQLIHSEQIVLNSGNSYLLRLNATQ